MNGRPARLRWRWLRISVLLACLAVAAVPFTARAHEIPPGASIEAVVLLVVGAVLAAIIGSRVLRP